MTTRFDMIRGDGTNTVFETSELYVIGTVKVELIDELQNSHTTLTTFTELGNGYLMVTVAPTDKQILKISYTIEGTMPLNNKDEYDIKKRVRELEEAIKLLHETNLALKEAINNRVSVSTFKAWTNLIEKKTGITLIDNPLGYISQELYDSKS